MLANTKSFQARGQLYRVAEDKQARKIPQGGEGTTGHSSPTLPGEARTDRGLFLQLLNTTKGEVLKACTREGVVDHTSVSAKMDWPNFEWYLEDRTPWIWPVKTWSVQRERCRSGPEKQ